MGKVATIRIERELRTGELEKRIAVEVTSEFGTTQTALKVMEKAWEETENGAGVFDNLTDDSEGTGQ